jgi:penicillin G amidase
MKVVYFLLSAAITVGLVFILHTKAVLPAPLGKLLAPQTGVWQNAEAENASFDGTVLASSLKGKTEVFFDDRLVPHIFAEQDMDAYFVQGYLHAKFRLFQMEMQTHFAAGRASEFAGEIALPHDKEFRRLGMVYAAENSLKAIEADDTTKQVCDNYTAGVNAYINSLTEASLPIEYKLLGKQPEQWSNFKSALFLKLMSFDLASLERDFEMTNAKSFFSKADFDLLYPAVQDSLDPIIPKSEKFIPASIKPVAPKNADSAYFAANPVAATSIEKPDKDNGSNNWAVSGAKTASGKPILCSDPHLGLTLPSIWYEQQMVTANYNAYGVSFPGAPGVIIGFNDSIAFGFTNGGRDVRDYYEIKFKDDSKQQYWFNNAWKNTEIRIEEIKIAGKPTVYDTVAYTVFGPVMYDKSFSGNGRANGKAYAVRWKPHDGSNDLKAFVKLDYAKNHADYVAATYHLQAPGQNCVFASKAGDIAIRTQGAWPAKWQGQGDFIMPGTDSSYMWQGVIPNNEVPFQYNPARAFVSSANQKPVHEAYPYYIGKEYPVSRGLVINKLLAGMQAITPQSMMALQTNNYNIYASQILPLLIKNIKTNNFTGKQAAYFDSLKSWNYYNDANSTAATTWELLLPQLRQAVYNDEFANAPSPIMRPFESTLIEALLKDTAYKFVDNVATPNKENLADIASIAFENTCKKLDSAAVTGSLQWAAYKGTSIRHLLRLPAFARANLPIGGGGSVINATKEFNGPSWRMVVHLTDQTEAYAVYPGGQNGNPGSKYYDSFVDKWAAGEYYKLWVMSAADKASSNVKWKMQFSKN